VFKSLSLRKAEQQKDKKLALYLGIPLAVICAIVTQLGFLYKHRGANAVPLVNVRRPLKSLISLFKSRWFTIGILVGLGAWLLHLAALAVAPLTVVQIVLSTGIVILAVLADRIFGYKVGKRQWLGVFLTTFGLLLLVTTLPLSHEGPNSSFSHSAMIAFEAGMIGIGAVLITGRKRFTSTMHHHGVILGFAAGLLFGVSDVAVKALTGIAGHGAMAVVLSPWLAVTIIATVISFYASARGLQEGEALPVIASTAIAANISNILGGILVFGDPLASNWFGIVIQVTAFLMVIGAAAVMPAPIRATRA
jgi:drug/metabolite transporter (DMT)-like permease